MKNNSKYKMQVEKIGGACMSQMDVLLQNVFINLPDKNFIRIFVVSAYSGVTDLLIGNKDETKDGVLQFFYKDKDWKQQINILLSKLLELNRFMQKYGLPLHLADRFITHHIEDLVEKLQKIQNSSSNTTKNFWAKEYLSAIGEIHSAYNCHQILNSKNLDALFVNLADPTQTNPEFSLEKNIELILQKVISKNTVIPIVTGYCWSPNGMVKTYGRGYSEITFAKILQIVDSSIAIIHKEFPICRIDPKFAIPRKKLETLKYTTYQSLLSLRDTEMQVIHPETLKILLNQNLPLQVQSIYTEFYEKTCVGYEHHEESQKIEIISGYRNCSYLKFDQEKDFFSFLKKIKQEGFLPLYAQKNCVLIKKTRAIQLLIKEHSNIPIPKVSWIVGIGPYPEVLKLEKEFLSTNKQSQKSQIFSTYVEEGLPSKIHLIVSAENFYDIIFSLQEHLFLSQPSPTRV